VHNIATQVKDGQGQQTRFDQTQNIKNPPGPAIATVKGMNGLELMVADGHLDQRIQVLYGVDKALPS